MDVASRFHNRQRSKPFSDRQLENSVPDDGSGTEADSRNRRKFQRTSSDATDSLLEDSTVFRKPTVPASALRSQLDSQQHSRPAGGSIHQRRRSAALRENPRVPSGPREFPSPSKRASSYSRVPSINDTADRQSQSLQPRATLLPNVTSESFYSKIGEPNRLSFGNQSSNGADSPLTPAEGALGSIDFIPTVSFDDFQATLANLDGSSSLPDGFPTTVGARSLPQDASGVNSNPTENGSARRSVFDKAGRQERLGARLEKELEQSNTKSGLSRSQSFRKRMSSISHQTRHESQSSFSTSLSAQQQGTRPETKASTSESLSFRLKTPRKSVGSIFTADDAKQTSLDPNIPQDTGSNRASMFISSTSGTVRARRSIMQPSSSETAATLPRLSTFTAMTAPRTTGTKDSPQSMKAQDPDTPLSASSSTRPTPKTARRTGTPSSSGNKRQSTISGRASGLGARTISPTDARRLKGTNTDRAPPMPSAYLPKASPSTFRRPTSPKPSSAPAHDSFYASAQIPKLPYPDLPRQGNKSPSLIPRKASQTPLSSARASPESLHSVPKPGMNHVQRGSELSISSKSSYQSLLASSTSNSRLPTPRARTGTSNSALGSYSSSYGSGTGPDSFGEDDLVPPVPAIPKLYESPKDLEPSYVPEKLFAPPRDSPQPNRLSKHGGLLAGSVGLWDRSLDVVGGGHTDSPLSVDSSYRIMHGDDSGSRSSRQTPSQTPRKPYFSDEMDAHPTTDSADTRTHTPGRISRDTALTFDPTGRKNANLQPLRLPPLSLFPVSAEHRSGAADSLPTSSVSQYMNFGTLQTPEPTRAARTPTTPMTASKAMFFNRNQRGDPIRSSSSHFTLREALGSSFGDDATKWFDESDFESQTTFMGSVSASNRIVPERARSGQRGITPFASGSLPKVSGELGGQSQNGPMTWHSRGLSIPSDEYSLGHFDNIEVQNARPWVPRLNPKDTLVNATGEKTGSPAATPKAEDSSTREKESSSSGGLRRRLSRSWRRSSSKSAIHGQKDDVRHDLQPMPSKESMPPPKLPASLTWNGDMAHSGARKVSLDSSSITSKRKSNASSLMTLGIMGSNKGSMEQPQQVQQAPFQTGSSQSRTTKLHSDQPQPVSHGLDRSSSFNSISRQRSQGVNGTRQHRLRQNPTMPLINALKKDQDDLTADEEMKKLSQKRRDVDAAARETEHLWSRAKPRQPVSPERVLLDRSCNINLFERGEIVDYDKDGIYFTGKRSAKKVVGTLDSGTQLTSSDKDTADKTGNHGYDDERGDYNIVLGDHLAYRYEVVDVLGKGSFGQVVRCIDHKEGGVVAVKIIRNKKRFHQQALVEVGILGKLREWDPEGVHATLSITSSFYFRNHLCIVTPCLGMNLYELIRAHNFNGFSMPIIRRFSRQLLACLTLLQHKRIIHCDLKPENILLCDGRKADVRVIDFGSSCREEEKVYTYIQSRFYRSPEVILGSSYGLGIDMWSFGCILAELWTGYPIFPGENEQEQLACIMEIFGPPEKRIIDMSTRRKLFFDSVGKPRVTVSSKGRRRRPSSKTLQRSLKTEDEAFLDFIARCLRWDPERRMKPHEAVTHPFITNTSMQKRAGIPDEARRAAKLRPTAAVPTPAAAANGGPGAVSIPSPIKRAARTTQATELSSQPSASHQATPAKQQSRRELPSTPQTAVRGASSNTASQYSPIKATIASTNRRHSTLVTAGGANAMSAAPTGSKRISNAAAVASHMDNTVGKVGVQRTASTKAAADLAQLAAATSMSSASNGVNSLSQSRWRV